MTLADGNKYQKGAVYTHSLFSKGIKNYCPFKYVSTAALRLFA